MAPRRRSLLRSRSLVAGLGLFALCAVLGTLLGAWLGRQLPDLSQLADYRPPLSSHVFDRMGRPIGEFFAERRRLVPLEQLPRQLVLAFLAAEDAAFFEHRGVDLAALLRAAWANLRGGELRQGGSTITQQLAKRLFLSPERSAWRKLQDMLIALRIEARLSKQAILELYLNQIYLGNGAYGVAQAAESYFGKELSELTLAESALLAALPKAPSQLAPTSHPEAAEERRRYVLARMLELGFVDAAAGRAALDAPPRVLPRPPPQVARSAEYFVEEVRQALFAALGADAVLRGGLRVETTLDLALQRAATRAVREGLRAAAKRRSGEAAQRPAPEGALLALEVESGDVLALVGGYDFARSRFDRAMQARRQPGSAFKTFAYGAALEAGFTPDATVYDYQVEFPDPLRGGVWRPRNHRDHLRGPVPASEAFARSLNNATIRLVDDVGAARVADFARRAGIRSPLSVDLGLALGTSEVTLLEITSAYGSFANQGRPVEPRLVVRVLDRDGRVVLEGLPALERPEGQAPAGIAPVDAYLVTHLLHETVRAWYGTAHSAARLAPALAGKTGSTNGNRDAWFIGFSPEIVAGVWVGYDDHARMAAHETGARAALPIWVSFMESALVAHPPGEFGVPEGVRFASQDPETGERLSSAERVPGWVPIAAGRRARRSSYVPPPVLPEVPSEAPAEAAIPPELATSAEPPPVGAPPPAPVPAAGP